MSENYKKTKAKGIVDDLTKEQIREILVDEAEIFYKGTYCVIMNDDENVFTIGTANKECETDEVEELETKYDDIDEAVNAAVDLLFEAGKNAKDTKSSKNSKQSKTSSNKSKDSTKEHKKQSPKPTVSEENKSSEVKLSEFQGPKIIKVFAREVYIEHRPHVNKADILDVLRDEHGYYNFTDQKTGVDFDETTGIAEIYLKFNPKG